MGSVCFFMGSRGCARVAGLPLPFIFTPTTVGYKFRSLPSSPRLRRDRLLADKLHICKNFQTYMITLKQAQIALAQDC